MNKILRSFASMLVGTILVAGAQQAPVAQWNAIFGGANGDQSSAIAIDGSGNALWLSVAGSTEAAPEIFYNDSELFSGALYNAGNSANNNLALISTSANGDVNWKIYSTSGDYAASQGSVAVTPDGDIVFTAKVRHTDGMLDTPMNIIDASGAKYEFGGSVERRSYSLLVAKTDAQGNILWIKVVELSTAPAALASGVNADFTSDAVSSSALAVDDSGNIYIGGNYCADMTVDGVTIAPVNVSTWTGDSQISCGNLFILKLNPDGKYIASEVGRDDINGYSSVQSLEWHNGCLYLCAYAKGTGSFSFAGSTLTPSDIFSPIVGCLDSNLSAQWIKCCTSEPVDDKNALQNASITLCGDNLWLCGQFNQKIIDADNAEKFVAATQGKLREGFIVKFDKNNGEWLASADSKVGFPEISMLTGYLKVIQNPDCLDKVYVYGYVMNAAQGVFLRGYNADDLTPSADEAWILASGGGAPTACAIAYNPADASAYITARGNKPFTLIGDIASQTPKGWDILMARFNLPESFVSGIEMTNFVQPAFAHDVFDITGRRVASLETILSLAPGLYIANGQKFIVR